MRFLPFLPGLLFAVAAWIWPLFARILPLRLTDPLARRAPWLPPLAPWIRSAAIPYLAVILGWISARDIGLSGQTVLEWILGAVLALGLGGLQGWMAARLSPSSPQNLLVDEARWTLYRAASWPLAGFLWLAVVIGLVAGLGEWGLAWLVKRDQTSRIGFLALLFRTGCSALLFLVAHNFFLAVLMYATALAVQHPSFPAPWKKRPTA